MAIGRGRESVVEVGLRRILCVSHGSKQPDLHGDGEGTSRHLVYQPLQVAHLGAGAELEAKGPQQLPEISQLLIGRRGVHPRQDRQVLVDEIAGDRLVGRQHEFFDKRMRRIPLLPVDTIDLAILAHPDLQLGQIEKESASASPGILERISQERHTGEDLLVFLPVRRELGAVNLLALE